MSENKIFPLFFEKNRLATFKDWPFKPPQKCTKEKVAAAGFHFVGNRREKDLVQCVVCFKQLDGWEEDDDPWEEHSRRVQCPFIALNKREEDITLMELADLVIQRLQHQTKKAFDDAMSSYDSLFDEYDQAIDERAG